MTNKAYIVVNDQQEREVLEKLDREGFTWFGGDRPAGNMPSNYFNITIFPYIIFVRKNTVTWNLLSKLEDEEIVFDGRKEEHMSEKYVVSQEFMNELEEWKECLMSYGEAGYFVGHRDINGLPICVANWWGYEISNEENNNRLIAIIRWVNGEDVFEVEKPKKWVVRSKEHDEEGYYLYVNLSKDPDILHLTTFYGLDRATRFDTKEEAESWANSHQEVREVIEVGE